MTPRFDQDLETSISTVLARARTRTKPDTGPRKIAENERACREGAL